MPAHVDSLRAAGLRVTAGRRAVLGVLDAHPHATAATVRSLAREAGTTMSTQAVYDVLHALVGAGLARVIDPPGSAARYELRVGDNHHHLICRRCGHVQDVSCATGEAPCLGLDNDHGFVMDEAEITYWGLCARCAGAVHHEKELR